MIQPPFPAAGTISWIMVNTHPHKERFAVENLKGRQFIGYCPMLLKSIRHARQSEQVLRPMFPARVFAGLNTSGLSWRPILSTPGVSASGRKLLHLVPEGFVAALRACEIDGKFIAPGLSSGLSSEHQRSEPDYKTLITKMVEMSEDDRLRALFGLLGPETKSILRTQGHAEQ